MELNAFVMVIVGRGTFPAALYVSLHAGLGHYELEPTSA